MRRSRQILALSFVLALSFIVRWVNLTTPSLWTDELATCWVASAPSYSDCAARASATQGQSPFYYMVIKTIFAVFPRCELSMRLPSVLFSLVSTFLVWSLAKRLFDDDRAALVGALIFALNETLIHQAQEARPYAMGVMFVLMSQWLFWRLVADADGREASRRDGAPSLGRKAKILAAVGCAVASILMIWSHYLNASVLLAQNAFVLAVLGGKWRGNRRFLSLWAGIQIVVLAGVLVMVGQWGGMLRNRGEWDWVGRVGVWDALKIFLSLFDGWIILGLAAVSLVIWRTGREVDVADLRRRRREALFLGIWLIAPLVFNVVVSEALGVSLVSRRYLALATVPYCVLLGRALFVFKSKRTNGLLVTLFFTAHAASILVPNLIEHGGFTYRVADDWRAALRRVDAGFRPGDGVLLRSGFVKENWLPETDDPLIRAYCRCPFDSFYVKKRYSEAIPVHNLTYTFDEEAFGPYFERTLAALSARDRVWVVGVDPPNTNYPVARAPLLLVERGFTKVDEWRFGGVYLCLMAAEDS